MIVITGHTFETIDEARRALDSHRRGYADARAQEQEYAADDSYPDAPRLAQDAADVAQDHLNRIRELEQEIAKVTA